MMSPSRRQFLALLPAPFLARFQGTGGRFKLAICNEIYKDWGFSESCKAAVADGYTGLEIAPYTLSDDPIRLTVDQRRTVRRTMESEGLTCTGLHWLLSTPKGLHITTPDRELRKKSWDYLRGLIDLAADLGDDPVMVLGSGKARDNIEGSTVEDAVNRLKEGLAGLAPSAERAGVTIVMEPLAPHLCRVVNTLGEAMEIVRAVNSPAIQTIFDVHNAAAEPLPHDESIRKYYDHIRYVQLNEMDGGYPGSGDYDFRPALKAFKELNYRGWMSMEVFDLSPGPEKISKESAAHIRSVEATL